MTARGIASSIVVGAVLLLSGCSASLSPAQRAALDRAGQEMDRQLTPAGQLAATAALIHAETGSFPETRFELLGSPQAGETGARQLNLSALQVETTGDAFRLSYVLLPTRADPTDRMGSFTLRPGPDEPHFEATVELLRREDPDHGGRPLFLAREDQFGVTRLSGHFHIDLGTVRDQAAVGEAGDLPLDAQPYRITFTPSPAFLDEVPRELAEGYTVTLPR